MRLSLISSIEWKKKSSSSKAMKRGGGGRRRRQRGEDWEIPLDLQVEILTRLPTISLMRFKCVSKLWSSLIRCRYFSNYYLKVASLRRPQQPRLYMSLVDHNKFTSSTDLCENPSESVLLSSSSSTSTGAKCFDQALTMPGIGGRGMVILRGLILYIVCRQACIYNPTTRQNVTLPAVKSNIIFAQEFRKSVFYFLGHDPVLDQYKVVCTLVILTSERIITSEHWVFVLEVGGSWKRIEFDQPHLPTKPGVCINGVIYYMASTGLSPRPIVSFDVRSEEFNMFQAPHVLPHLGRAAHVGFIEYAGKPAIIDHTNLPTNGSLDLWVLEDAENWSRKSLVLQPRQMHLLTKPVTVEGTTLNGEVIFAFRRLVSPCYILYYDLQNNHLRKVRIFGIPNHWFSKPNTRLSFYFKHLDTRESIMHLET